LRLFLLVGAQAGESMSGVQLKTVYDAFQVTASQCADHDFLCIPALDRADRRDITFGEIAEQVARSRQAYIDSGFGLSSRVAVMLPTRPEFVVHFLALNGLGCVVIPVNPDNKIADLAYLMNHSEAEAMITTADRVEEMEQVRSSVTQSYVVVDVALFPAGLHARDCPADARPELSSICSILYTSGTTGQPKGCMLSNECHLIAGAWYRDMGGVLAMGRGTDRFYNPTPFHHVNNLVVTLTCVILTGNCLILVDRFRPARWWAEISASDATIMHYVGIIPSILMNSPVAAPPRHRVRFGFGAGIEPQLHRSFEARFGIPLVEIWGMTETPRVFGDNFEPRQIDTRAFGRPTADYEARVVDEQGNEQPNGVPGELQVRSSGPDCRKGFFSGYLKDLEATERAWQGGWLNTGDVVTQSADGMLYFVDRKKNIIRRAGENISAVEVEGILITHPRVAQAAVIAVPDELRDEEVMACIVAAEDSNTGPELANEIASWFLERASYYKCPGWIAWVDGLPVTPSQRVQRTRIFPSHVDPRRLPGVVDLRPRKKR
jgi:crotonobetaine/carnitine-CoA ligase